MLSRNIDLATLRQVRTGGHAPHGLLVSPVGTLLQPVCTTELGTAAKYQEEFAKRGVKMYALSCNDVESHKKWITDIEAAGWAGGKKARRSWPSACWSNEACIASRLWLAG
jgi:AhpC/TSA family